MGQGEEIIDMNIWLTTIQASNNLISKDIVFWDIIRFYPKIKDHSCDRQLFYKILGPNIK